MTMPYLRLIAEKTQLDGSIGEHALAHKLKDKSVAAYQRGALIDKRKVIMQDYANYAYSNPDTPRDNVSQIRA